MAASTTELLADIKTGLDAIREGQEQLKTTLGGHGEILRLVVERMDLVIEKLHPGETEGPTLQELLAELVIRVGDNWLGIHRIDRRTESMADNLPRDIVMALTGHPIGTANGGSGGGGHASAPPPAGANGNGHAS